MKNEKQEHKKKLRESIRRQNKKTKRWKTRENLVNFKSVQKEIRNANEEGRLENVSRSDGLPGL